MPRRGERGVALVWAIGVLGVLTAIGVSVGRLTLGTHETRWNLVARAQADALLRSAVTLATVALEAHAAGGEVDTLRAPWAAPVRHAVGTGWIAVEIEDLGRRIDLQTPALRPAVARLAETLGLAENVAPAIADWIDADDDPRPGGAEAAWYARHGAPGHPANAPLPTVHHLRFVRAIDAAAFARLAAHTSVLGPPGVNPNTAPPEVLAAWLGDPVHVARILRDRRDGPLDCVGLRHCVLRSRRFLVHARAGVGPVERRAAVVVLVTPGLPGTVEAWEPALPIASHGGDERRRRDRLAQHP